MIHCIAVIMSGIGIIMVMIAIFIIFPWSGHLIHFFVLLGGHVR